MLERRFVKKSLNTGWIGLPSKSEAASLSGTPSFSVTPSLSGTPSPSGSPSLGATPTLNNALPLGSKPPLSTKPHIKTKPSVNGKPSVSDGSILTNGKASFGGAMAIGSNGHPTKKSTSGPPIDTHHDDYDDGDDDDDDDNNDNNDNNEHNASLTDYEDEFSEEFKEFAKEFKAALAPVGAVESFLADRATLTAWRLQRAAEELGTDPGYDDPTLIRAEDRAERSLLKTLACLDKKRDSRMKQSWGKPAARESKSLRPQVDVPPVGKLSALASAVAQSSAGSKVATAKAGPASSDESTHWRERLVKDPSISTDSPIVKDTNITVKHVVTLVVDGWTWGDIVRAHPQLTEDDIRACLWFAVEEENASLKLK